MRYQLIKRQAEHADRELSQALTSKFHISAAIAELLQGRGIRTMEQAEEFLCPDASRLHDPFLFGDMHDCVSMVKSFIAQKKKICVYGDYDADGVCACAILYQALRRMGADVACFMPERTDHGYGLSMEVIGGLEADLLITVDCGITNVEEIELAKTRGMKTIVTDHHECPAVLPRADFILNARREGEAYPYKDLCGAGVAFKLACALAGDSAMEYIDLAAFATIADIVPLLGENRVITAVGLRKMNEDPNAGLLALFGRTGQKKESIDSQTVAFVLAPRLNAAGRLASAQLSFELLVTEDEARREALAGELCDLNAERQRRQEAMVAEALQMPVADGDRIAVLYSKSWDIGIVGLAASKLAEALHRPALLLGESNGLYTGSARSVDGVDIYAALATQSQLYEKFGGHKGAAGLTLKEENIPQLRSRINAWLKETYPEELFRPVRCYDVELKLGEINESMIADMDRLQPFGHANHQVDTLIRHAKITNPRPIGDGKHMRFALGGKLNAVAFRVNGSALPASADVVGTLAINDYDNKPQMVVDVFSFDEGPAMLYARHRKALADPAPADEAGRLQYFIGREDLLKMYFALKESNGKSFADMDALLRFAIGSTKERDLAKIAFLFAVLEDIGLLRIKNNGKISLVICHKKSDLSNSATYRKYSREDA